MLANLVLLILLVAGWYGLACGSPHVLNVCKRKTEQDYLRTRLYIVTVVLDIPYI